MLEIFSCINKHYLIPYTRIIYVGGIFSSYWNIFCSPNTNTYPFQQKEKIKPEKIVNDYTYFWFVFSYFLITVTIRMSSYFTWEWWTWDLWMFIIPLMFFIKLLDIGIPLILFVSSNFISEEYMKVIILSAKSALTNEFLFTTILSRSSFNNSIVQ